MTDIVSTTRIDQGQEPVRISHMTVTEMISFGQQLRNKAETEWQKVINLHAALIGVMIFFAGQANPYVTARLVVFCFYTFNVVTSYVSLKEVYAGLHRVNQDLRRYPPSPNGGECFDWILARGYRRDTWSRSGLLMLVWAVVGYLLVLPLWIGTRPGLP